MRILTAVLTLLVLSSIVRATDAWLPAAPATIPPAGASVETAARAAWQKRWTVSLVPVVASQALDVASSYGKRELNPVLAGPNGGFGTKATGLKFGAAGALIGVEFLLVKKFPRSAKLFTVLNWSTSAATTGLAVHNFTLR